MTGDKADRWHLTEPNPEVDESDGMIEFEAWARSAALIVDATDDRSEDHILRGIE